MRYNLLSTYQPAGVRERPALRFSIPAFSYSYLLRPKPVLVLDRIAAESSPSTRIISLSSLISLSTDRNLRNR